MRVLGFAFSPTPHHLTSPKECYESVYSIKAASKR